MHARVRRYVAVGAAVAAAALALSGCASSASGTPAGATTATLDPAHPVKISVIRSAGAQFEPLEIGIKEGFFADEGLDVDVKAGTGNPATLAPQLVSGQIQFAMIDIATPIAAASQDVPISLISAIYNDDPSNKASSGLLVPPGSSITSIADLKGKTIATNQLAGSPVVSVNKALKDAGVPLDSIKWVQLTPDSLADAALGHQADAILTFGAFFQGAIQKGFTFLDATSGGMTFPRVTQVAWGAANKYMASNPAVVAAFIRANERAQEFANKNPDRVREIDTRLTKLPADYIAKRPIAPFGGPFHVDVIQQMADAMYAQGFIKKKVDVASQLLWPDAEKN
ncbi:ABC transporter substrate-binding protein [Microbacterium horticulturae]|uniref:ABC transporter substrate-binding protein n=1 Tax=Microbacterium horticulturae TaxID=3028316 RepID=A0ABY8BWC7_9MICO|nr:ABC transporter substrate-binding protein [Microbacterium sp. KACC 23027]WEG08499.1 ABC transporter substrate-binding protein [Microbacterium sp. KACC 23027]